MTDVEKLLGGINDVDKLLQSLPKNDVAASLLSGFSMEGIVASIVFGIIGMVYARNGKKHGPLSTMFCGFVLMFFPYFVTDVTYIVAIGIFFTVLPFILKRWQR
ncbi:MAG: hypothetical protein HW380_3485 [Magnetococcales bacterium]|nr:hypothetical protein [Magnetococcales bacterium]HIJ85679.1 hypothetical protein [Magnetococcales bacterium]